jgi:hypothetical protein
VFAEDRSRVEAPALEAGGADHYWRKVRDATSHVMDGPEPRLAGYAGGSLTTAAHTRSGIAFSSLEDAPCYRWQEEVR